MTVFYKPSWNICRTKWSIFWRGGAVPLQILAHYSVSRNQNSKMVCKVGCRSRRVTLDHFWGMLQAFLEGSWIPDPNPRNTAPII